MWSAPWLLYLAILAVLSLNVTTHRSPADLLFCILKYLDCPFVFLSNSLIYFSSSYMLRNIKQASHAEVLDGVSSILKVYGFYPPGEVINTENLYLFIPFASFSD
jgi:hypothetical protein